MKNIKYIFSLAALAIVAGMLWAGAFHSNIALANPFYVGTKAKSAIATSTVTYLTLAIATTSSTVYDSYEVNGTNQPNGGNQTLPDSVAFLIRGVASSTATTITIACEFGDDEIAGNGNAVIDWYQNEILGATTTNAGVQTGTTQNSLSFVFASSTVGGAPVLSTSSSFQKLFTCPVPVRYVRPVISVTGAPASVWVGIVPKKQRN